MSEIKADMHLESVCLRHKASDQKRLTNLREAMKGGWSGRPLLVIKRPCYEVLTGCHRAAVAMELGIPIPVIAIPDEALTPEQREQVLSGEQPYDTLAHFFRENGLDTAATLMEEEMKSSWAEPVAPTVMPRTRSRAGGIRRVVPNPKNDKQ